MEDLSALDAELSAAAGEAAAPGPDAEDSSPPPSAPAPPKKTLLDVLDDMCLAGFEREGTRAFCLSRPLLAAGKACLGMGRCIHDAAACGDAAALEPLLLRWRNSPSASSVVNWRGVSRGVLDPSPTPLMAACDGGHEAAVALLLGPSAPAVSRKALDSHGDDALVHAIRGPLSTATVEAMQRDWGYRDLSLLQRDLRAAINRPAMAAALTGKIAAERSRRDELARRRQQPQQHNHFDGFLSAYIRSPVEDDLQGVPGIGPATEAALRAVGVTTQYQLFGVYLSFRGPDVGPADLQERFFQWLKNRAGLKVRRGEIAQAVTEKLNMMLPGCYDPDL